MKAGTNRIRRLMTLPVLFSSSLLSLTAVSFRLLVSCFSAVCCVSIGTQYQQVWPFYSQFLILSD